jgi:nucleoside-diphosphate-sugar epimerase
MLHRIPSTAKIESATGWQPTRTLDDILADVLAFERRRSEVTL